MLLSVNTMNRSIASNDQNNKIMPAILRQIVKTGLKGGPVPIVFDNNGSVTLLWRDLVTSRRGAPSAYTLHYITE